MKHNVVLLTSALYTNYGVFNPSERKAQTLETIKSIRQNIPNSIIMIIENSTEAIQEDTSAEMETIIDSVDYFFDNSDDPDIKYFHKNVSNYDIGKNSMETIGTLKVLMQIKADPELLKIVTESDRIFKVSGRYLISEKFNFGNFSSKSTQGKYVFKKAAKAWIPEADTGVTTLLQTRLWSFCPELFDETLSIYQMILNNMFNTVNKQKYIDIEHSMSKFIPKEKLVELEFVGVKGNIAPNGAAVED